MNNKYMIVSIVPFIISLVFDLSGIPTIIDTRIPPTKPPIWAAISIPGDRNPIIRFMIKIVNKNIRIII